MTSIPETQLQQSPENDNSANQVEKILCPYCLRTASNGIKCKGKCVADSDY